MYLLALIVPFCLAYFILGAIFSLFFDGKLPSFSLSKSARSLLVIVSFALGVFAIISSVSDPELGNRIEHALGGGALASLICFLAVKDTRVSIGRFQFFVFVALIVTSLGVLNEIVEFFLQTHTRIIFSGNALDTWRDLSSNTAGIALALAALSPFVAKRER